MEMNYLKEKQKMSIALIVSCAAVVLSLLGVAGGLFQETAFYLHECLAVIVWIGMLIIPLELFIWLRLIRLCKKEGLQAKSKFSKALSVFVVFSLLFTIFSGFVFSQSVHSNMEFVNGVKKLETNGKYYIIAGSQKQKLKVTEEQYNRIKEGELYV
ncbi:MAG: hypothetical protein ACLU4W_11500, partial [Acutalibacteraceae bacterium]